MTTPRELEVRREEILSEMRSIRSMKRGSINEQFLPVRLQGVREPVQRGPYYVFSRREGSKTASRRIQPGPELEQAHKDIAEHKRFVALCREFEEVTERLGELERGTEAVEAKKKPRRSSSSRRKK